MKKKIALAFAGLMLMIVFFAPTTAQPWHGLPTVQEDTYIVVGGEMNATVQLHLGPVALPPLGVPFVTRPPYLTPTTMWQNINFSVAIDPGIGVPAIVFLTVPQASIQSLDHVFFSSTLGYTRVRLVPAGDGMGWLYLLPNIADVDIYVNNTYVNASDWGIPGPYNVENPDTIPVAIWASPSPMAGAIASPTGGPFDPFPDPGLDTLPGFCPRGPGTQDDGFGDGVPDPAGSSVLFLPMMLTVDAWNGTHWDFQFGGPFILPLTTGTASDTVWPPTGRALDGLSITFTGAPWENLASTGLWGENENKKTVTYVCAWSFIQYYLSDGPPVVKLDLIYGIKEKKVKDIHVIPDINCDNVVDIFDLRIAAKSFGLHDEGIPAYPGYEPPWWWEVQTTELNPETGLSYGPYPPEWVAVFGCPMTVYADPNFDARADLDNNGLIDIFDLRRIAKHYLVALDP